MYCEKHKQCQAFLIINWNISFLSHILNMSWYLSNPKYFYIFCVCLDLRRILPWQWKYLHLNIPWEIYIWPHELFLDIGMNITQQTFSPMLRLFQYFVLSIWFKCLILLLATGTQLSVDYVFGYFFYHDLPINIH